MSKRSLTLCMTLCMFFALLVSAHGVHGDENQELNLKGKTKKVKRIVRRSIFPFRSVLGIPKTGQTESYAEEDDGDLQKGMPWPEPRFEDKGDGTVTDRLTGLMWVKDVQKISPAISWLEAVGICRDLTLAGHDNWRLPNIRELLSLVDYGANDPALPEGHPFTGVQLSGAYWSSTTSLPHTAQAWYVEMRNGHLRRNSKSSALHFVWPVRRGRHNVW